MIQEYLSKASSGEIAVIVAMTALSGGGIVAIINSVFGYFQAKAARASEERRHQQTLDSEQRKLEATIESERRRQAQSLAVQMALEKWKIDHALAVKYRDAKGNRIGGDDPMNHLTCFDVVVEDMVKLTEAISRKKQP